MQANLDLTINAEPRTCERCNGAGQYPSPWEFEKGKIVKCLKCDGAGRFPAVNVEMILAAIKGRKGLRSAAPKPRDGSRGYGDIHDKRAYYVWRLARFHGGEDVTMPVTASMLISGDAFLPELDALADAVAKRVFRTNLAAAHRWGRALGHIDRDLPGLPATAYQGGPVLNSGVTKPDDELPELR
jgi:hypothetical protein